METKKLREQIISLICSGQAENIELALLLAESQVVDLSDFWADCHFLLEGASPNVANLCALFSAKELNWARHDVMWIPFTYRWQPKWPQVTIRVLHPAIGWLRQLEVLDISNHSIQYLPAQIGALSNLRRLHLSNNKLCYIPPQIGRLKKLELLELSVNRLSILPAEIADLGQLQALDLEFNPIENTELDKLRILLPQTRIAAKFIA